MSSAAAACESEYKGLVRKLDAVIRDKWPETLTGLANPYEWARANQPEAMKQRDALLKEMDELWLNGCGAEFKKLAVQWGQAELKIYRFFAAFLRQGGTA